MNRIKQGVFKDFRRRVGIQFFAGDRVAEIETRLAAIRTEMSAPDADLDALDTEADALIAERKAIADKAEQRRALLGKIGSGEAGAEVRTFPGAGEPEQRTYDAASPEYRTAFLKNLLDQELTKEERAAFTMTTDNTGAVIPVTMLNSIWDLVSKQHVIMGDVTVYRTGTVLEIIKHTEITQGKAKSVAQNAANEDEKNTFVKVSLSGKDFSKHTNISYAAAKMSIDALEAYLTNEIAGQLGEVMADDCIATIKDGVNAANKLTTASATVVTYAELVKAFGTLKRASNIRVYVNYATLYNQLVSLTDTTGRPLFQPNMQAGAQGVLLGGTVKVEESMADGEILIGDSAKVVYNMVQDIMLESDKDIKNHTYTYSGYARGEGALIDDKAFALLSLKAGA